LCIWSLMSLAELSKSKKATLTINKVVAPSYIAATKAVSAAKAGAVITGNVSKPAYKDTPALQAIVSGKATTLAQVKAIQKPIAAPARAPTNFPISPKPMAAAAASSPAGSGFDFGALGAGALAIGDVALDLSPVGVGMGILSDVGNLAGMSLNALGLGGKKKRGVNYGDGKYRRRRGASYWRNKYEAMYWKAKYENARYGHGRMK